MRIESKKTSYYCCVVCVCACVSLKSKRISMRKVTIRCRCVRDGKKILSLWFSPQNKAYSGTQKATMAKKKKERSVQNRPKNCVLEKDFVSCDTLFWSFVLKMVK